MTNPDAAAVRKPEIKWVAVLWYIHLHVLGLYGIYLIFTVARWSTILFTFSITFIGCLGVTVGAHRLWAHRAFKASGSLRIFLMLAHTLAGVGPIYDWVLAHRIHHKFYGTDKDPYNHNKGFWYSHYYSNLLSKHPDYDQIKMAIDMRDMEEDGYVWLQKQFYWILFPIVGLLFPLNAPLEYWDESLATTVCLVGFLRFAITVNAAGLVNSAMLIWSVKDGEKIPCQDNSIFFINKSHWLGYHYVIPWDWKSGEFGKYGTGCNSFIIKAWYELGLVSELQTISSEEIREALYKVAVKKSTLRDVLDELKELATLEAKREKLFDYK